MKNTIVVAHRGLSCLYPENTLISFRKAMEIGVDIIELDVRETKDGKIVVIHDEKVDRTTNGTGYVEELRLDMIRKLDAGEWKGAFKDVKVPTLEETLEILDKKTKLLIEIKQADVKKIIDIVRKKSVEEKVIIGSFHLKYLIETRKLFPSLPTAFITSKIPDNIYKLLRWGIQMINIEYHTLTDEIFKTFTEKGFVVNAWTVDRRKDMEKLISVGIPLITTNYPDILKKVIRIVRRKKH